MQKSFSDLEYPNKKKLTRRDRFLAEIDVATPWGKLHQEIEPFYPKVKGAGRPPIGLARMLRMYVAQQCFGLSDEGIEDAIYDSQAIRGFVGIDLNRESAPDATTLLKFRHLLEANGLTKKIFDTINGHLAEKGLMMREGTIVDATLIAAPTVDEEQGRRARPGNAPVEEGKRLALRDEGSCRRGCRIRSRAHRHRHGWQRLRRHPSRCVVAWRRVCALGDAGYQGVEKRPENQGKSVTWHVAMKRSKRKALPKNKVGRLLEKLEHLKASVRAKVEHPFHVVKNLFRHRKTRYRGLAKNTAQLFTLFGLANLVLAGRRFSVTESRRAS